MRSRRRRRRLARLNWRLGLAYAEAVKETARKHRAKLDLVGCHGQTLYHQPRAKEYCGRKFACTWQAGEAQAIAAELGVPVVSNFRPADMLAGGEGAPLVPLLDYVLFADDKRGRVLQNIGGIANLTAIPAGADAGALMAFDTGPGNMVIDWLAQKLFEKRFDRDGALAAKGRVLAPVIEAALEHEYFRLKPPKSAGREQFGSAYAADFLDRCLAQSESHHDALATATALTAKSIARSYARFVAAKMVSSGAKAPKSFTGPAYGLKPVPFKTSAGLKVANSPHVDFIVSGGGARNKTLMSMLAERLEPLGCKVMTSDKFGMPVEAKEAAAFALLAWQTWHRLPAKRSTFQTRRTSTLPLFSLQKSISSTNWVRSANLADSPRSTNVFKILMFFSRAYSRQAASWDSRLVPSICSLEETRQ